MKPIFNINRWKSLLKGWKALLLYAFGDEDVALHEFEKCLELDPRNGPNLVTLGKILVSKGNYLGGLEKLEEALKYSKGNSQFPEMFAYIAHCYYKLNRMEAALSFYEKAIDTWRRDGDFKKADLLYGLGRIYLQQKKYDKAIDTFNKGLSPQTKEALLHFGLGVAYFEIGRKEDGMYHLEIAKGLDPKFRNNETIQILLKELGSSIPIH
jgi:tetratricopeptide (TPR) repeat protein